MFAVFGNLFEGENTQEAAPKLSEWTREKQAVMNIQTAERVEENTNKTQFSPFYNSFSPVSCARFREEEEARKMNERAHYYWDSEIEAME